MLVCTVVFVGKTAVVIMNLGKEALVVVKMFRSNLIGRDLLS